MPSKRPCQLHCKKSLGTLDALKDHAALAEFAVESALARRCPHLLELSCAVRVTDHRATGDASACSVSECVMYFSSLNFSRNKWLQKRLISGLLSLHPQARNLSSRDAKFFERHVRTEPVPSQSPKIRLPAPAKRAISCRHYSVRQRRRFRTQTCRPPAKCADPERSESARTDRCSRSS
jgi:hypothetical protein